MATTSIVSTEAQVSDRVIRNRVKITDIVDEDLSSAARWRASEATTTSTETAAAAIATSRRPAFVASAGWRRSGKARFGLTVLKIRLSVPWNAK